MMKMISIMFVVMAMASVSAVPVTDVETSEEFGVIKESLANFGSWLKGKECRMQACPAACERKFRLAWGRRLLSTDDLNDSDETEADIQTGSQAQWGVIKKAVTKVLPKKVYYDDCSRKNSCLSANAGCKAKLDSLRAAVAALDKEIAAAKKVADAHSATAAQKAKYADLKEKDAGAAKALLDEAQSAVAAKAKDLADSKKHQDNIKAYQTSEVAKDARAKAYTLREHAEEVKDLKEAQEEMAEANKAVDHATKAHAAQLAEQKAQNAKAAARVAEDAAELKEAEGAIAGFAKTHHSAKAIAAKAKADAAAAQALANVKKDVVKLHQDQRNATAKKIEQAQ
jgi:chromosome segregation ATPase